MSSVEVIRASCLGGTPHGFLGRRGGVSGGPMWGLNVGYGSGDNPELIGENRRRVIDAVLPGARLVTVHQVHSGKAVLVDSPWAEADRPHADGIATDRPDVLLGVLTADCAPVLLADADAGVIGAAHAGWRGAVAGVTDATIEAMEKLGASRNRIAAAVGPCIAQPSYEVDHRFRSQLIEAEAENDRFFRTGPTGKPHFDLQAYVVSRLTAAGLGQVEGLCLDTYEDPDRFFSYRRAMHRGEPSYGRQISVIGVKS